MKRVLVVGDILADVYRECVFKKMCPDAPSVKAIVDVGGEVLPGGAANVAVNLAALTKDVTIDLLGVLDADLARVIKRASHFRVDMGSCVISPPLRKERIMLDGQFTLRVDTADLYEFQSDEVQESLRRYLSENEPDLIVLSDYGSCTVDRDTLETLLPMRERMLVDTKQEDLSVFASDGRRTLLVKLNDDEWKRAQAVHHSPEEFFRYVVVTHGARGSSLIMRSDPDRTGSTVCQTLPARGHDVPVVDVCGCGDTFLAGVAASLIAGSDVYRATQFANAAAATVVDQSRTAVADLDRTLGILGI